MELDGLSGPNDLCLDQRTISFRTNNIQLSFAQYFHIILEFQRTHGLCNFWQEAPHVFDIRCEHATYSASLTQADKV